MMKIMNRRILHVVMLVVSLMGMIIIGAGSSGIYVQAADDVSAIERAKQNVFRIEVSLICDGKSEPEPIRSGTCFVVGNEEKDQKQYLITTKTNLDISKKKIKNYRKENKLESNDNIQTLIEVVISEDIKRTATIYDCAQDSNYAILQIGETIKGCNGLTFGNLEQTKENAAIFLLTYDKDLCQVNLESTHLNQTDEKRIFYQAQVTEGYGAPVVDESGFLLGMRMPQETEKSELAEGLRVDILKNAFDTLGLAYENSDSKVTVLEKKLAEAKQTMDAGSYTKKTLTILEGAIDEAQSVYDDVKSMDSDYEAQVNKLGAAIDQLKPMREVYKLVMLVLAGVILLIILLLIIILIHNRKREKRLQYHTAEPADNKKQRKEKGKKSLQLDDDATVEVFSKLPTAYLIHKNSGTRLLIAKDFYVLGSKADSTDYCIGGNPAISRKHAAIVNENGILFLQDLGSTNHSYVNDQQLASEEKVVIRNKDVIRLANEEFVFELR